jgi:hypothetical protein
MVFGGGIIRQRPVVGRALQALEVGRALQALEAASGRLLGSVWR